MASTPSREERDRMKNAPGDDGDSEVDEGVMVNTYGLSAWCEPLQMIC